MNYRSYYIGANRIAAITFRVKITGHLLPNDDETVFAQHLNIRATNLQEAYPIAASVQDVRLNRL